MSIQSIITDKNLTTHSIILQSFTKESTALLMKLKYDVGCIDHNKMRNMLMIRKLFCKDVCFIMKEDDRELREKIIKESISIINEL